MLGRIYKLVPNTQDTYVEVLNKFVGVIPGKTIEIDGEIYRLLPPVLQGGPNEVLASALGAGGGVAPPTTAFAFEAEAASAFAAMTAAGATPNDRRKYSINRGLRRLKRAGILAKILGIYVVGDSEAGWLVNLKSPGTYNLTKVGTPVFAANDGVTTAALTSYYDTNIPLSLLGQNDVHMSVYSKTNGIINQVDCGAQDGSGNGLTMVCQGTGGTMAARVMSASVTTIGSANQWNGGSFHAVSRRAADAFDAYHHGIQAASPAQVSASVSASSATIRILGAAGNGTFSGRKIAAFTIGAGLTPAEMEILHATVRTMVETIQYGDVDVREAGYLPATVPAVDLVVYGTTDSGICAAVAAQRAGLSVALVGGWRDHPGNLGGISAGGLGYVDWDNIDKIGGMPRDVFQWLNNITNGGAMTSLKFVPAHFSWKMRQMLDSARSGGQSVPIYYTAKDDGSPGGVISVAKTGTRITSIATADGRTFSAKYFLDASAEGDLAWKAGCTMAIGREAAGSAFESINGYRGTLTTAQSDNHQFRKGSTFYNIDPFLTPGDVNSGLIAGVTTKPSKTVGQADDRTQAFNFRVTLVDNSALHRKVALPAAAPSGYAKANYEAALRYMAAAVADGQTLAMTDFMVPNPLYQSLYDVNNTGGFSTDYIGISVDYVATSSYAQREAIWKAHEAHIRGLFHALGYEADSRVPASLKSSMVAYGFPADHYLDPHPNDALYWPGQLYVRSCRRLVGDYVSTGNDLGATDGTAPRSTKTIAVASYVMDLHHEQRFADNSTGPWRIWNSGNVQAGIGGTDLTAPLPLEAFLPKASECTNLAVTSAVSATAPAFGSIRMQPTLMQVGESLGIIAKVAVDAGNVDLAAVNYATARTAILAAPDATPPVLPQVN